VVGSCRVTIIYRLCQKFRLNSDSFSIYLILSMLEKTLPYVIAIMSKFRLNSDSFSIYLILSMLEKTLPYVIAIYIVLCQNVIINILILTV